jgi:redox-sensitive bicupin YhaK (pirin superfamily)
MSVQPTLDPEYAAAGGNVELAIEARTRSLGEFDVRRVLPVAKRRNVGPFVFFDHMGPAVFPPGKGIAVRPHPHIGLATITFLFEGEIMHRDSIGYTQLIQNGAVNLMTAGRGVVHSERASEDFAVTSRLHGIQSWMALPLELEEMEPSFIHYPAATLPALQVEDCAVRVIMGSAFGGTSPVMTYSPTLYLEVEMPQGARFAVPAGHTECAAYVVTGAVRIEEKQYADGVMAVARTGTAPVLHAVTASRVMIIGGAPLGHRHIWWNFVSSSVERIEQAKRDWLEGRFGKVAGDDEFIPLPDH